MLQRTQATADLLKGSEDHLIITGLGSAANDVAHITDHHPRAFLMDGVMGAATSVGLGLALACPNQEITVVTGDGELLMNPGTLGPIAFHNPRNLRILVVDNGRYGLTGGQATPTDSGADIETVARGFGLKRTTTVADEATLPRGRELLVTPGDSSLVVLKVVPGPSADAVIERDGVRLRNTFRDHVLGLGT